jgi:hypothetical protein
VTAPPPPPPDETMVNFDFRLRRDFGFESDIREDILIKKSLLFTFVFSVKKW